MSSDLPTYDQLPIKPEYPPHSAWGVWGEDDNLGTLNLLTEDVVKEVKNKNKNGAYLYIANSIHVCNTTLILFFNLVNLLKGRSMHQDRQSICIELGIRKT